MTEETLFSRLIRALKRTVVFSGFESRCPPRPKRVPPEEKRANHATDERRKSREGRSPNCPAIKKGSFANLREGAENFEWICLSFCGKRPAHKKPRTGSAGTGV
jgi:hypothetical protein